MGRAPCCDKQGLKKGPWTQEEDKLLLEYIQSNGHGSWRYLPKLAGLLRCGKSCRLRWTNYLRPDIKRGPFTSDEQKSIIQLHSIVGNKLSLLSSLLLLHLLRLLHLHLLLSIYLSKKSFERRWSAIAAQLPGRTDNEVKNYWNTHLKKRLLRMGINPGGATTFTPSSGGSNSGSPSSSTAAAATRHMAQWESARVEAEARLSRESLLFSSSSSTTTTSSSSAIAAGDPPLNLEPPDFFLRLWNSVVGDEFRRPPASSAACKEESPAAESKCSCSEEDDVGSSSDETYKMYMEVFSEVDVYVEHYTSIFASADLGDASAFLAIDTAFK